MMRLTAVHSSILLALCLVLAPACGDDDGGGTGGDGSGGSGDDGSGGGTGDGTGGSGDGTGDGGTSGTGDGGTSGTGDGGTSGTGDGGTSGTSDGGTSGTGDGTTSGTGDGTTSGTTGGTWTTGTASTDTGTTSGGAVPGEDACPPNPGADAVLTGTVFAPEGGIPVSGALVYTSADPPDPVPDGVYCSECLELTCGDEDYLFTAADGTFALQATSGADRYLVVRKGEFMRVTQLTIAPGPTALDAALTTLPGQWDPPNGEYIPRIAVGDASYDRLEDALGKMGLGDTLIANWEERTVAGTESFDLWDNGYDPATDGFVSQGRFRDLVMDPDRMADYHVIFVPCSNDIEWDALGADQATARDNIQAWVDAGGRWYVADWSNEWLRFVFEDYQTFYLEAGSGDLGVYDSLGTVLDDGLLAWLEALPGSYKDINPLNDENTHPTIDALPQLMTVDNWSGIQYPLPSVMVPDGQGGQIDVGHVPWIDGGGGNWTIPANEIHPLTVTGQYGCGKIQFTSYHAAEFEDYVGLTPQELVLMYTILEIGVCQQDLPPPQ